MQVGADRLAQAAALEAALAVVSETVHHSPERDGAGIEPGAAAVVLEADQRVLPAGLELALDQHVADHAPLAGDRVERKHPGAGHLHARAVAVAAPEQLVAAADRKQRRSVGQRRLQLLRPPREIGGDQLLLAVLAAAQVDQVAVGRQRLPGADSDHVERVASAPGTAAQDGDVAAVGVDVELVGVEVADADRGHLPAFRFARVSGRPAASTGSAWPRSASSFCSSSMAV